MESEMEMLRSRYECHFLNLPMFCGYKWLQYGNEDGNIAGIILLSRVVIKIIVWRRYICHIFKILT